VAFPIPEFPFDPDWLRREAFAPISTATLERHLEKHRGYVRIVNRHLDRFPLGASMLHVIQLAQDYPLRHPPTVLRAAKQAWNHSFLWMCMRPRSHRVDHGLDDTYMNRKMSEMVKAGASSFGSGWLWLVLRGQRSDPLSVVVTPNEAQPFPIRRVHAPEGVSYQESVHSRPILVVDLWEHAYYCDMPNQRRQYVEAFLDGMVNWSFVVAYRDGPMFDVYQE